jgi:hypothetical protein
MNEVRRNRRVLRIDAASGCWTWTANVLDRFGYAQCKRLGRRWLAHRLSWTLAHGEIPDGLTVDHICFNRACVNPEHLQLLTASDNAKRQRLVLFRTHCKSGLHEQEAGEHHATAHWSLDLPALRERQPAPQGGPTPHPRPTPAPAPDASRRWVVSAERAFDHGELNIPGRLKHLDRDIDREVARQARERRKEARAAAQERYAARKADRAAEKARHKLTADDVRGAVAVRDAHGWHRVVRVSAKSVTVETAWSWTERIPLDRVLEVRR